MLYSGPLNTHCGSHVILQGIETKNAPLPLHWVHLGSDLVSGCLYVGVVSTLPVKVVTLLLWNDIAGGNVTPVLEVVENPEIKTVDDKLVQAFPQAGRCGGHV
ncbi:unnamed protein product [Oncorhynchus mykiss]|uniref:Uncharacterized protein n=1 Tax=Oncorhynchus mykiss TaxID=8022 RepID=A0A060XWM3_ONCMY|nr:unnamed protein product [Oncorhynchus mykiss]